MSAGPKNLTLCRLEEIPDGTAKGFSLERGEEELEIFVVRLGKKVRGYHNVCPHIGSPLDWMPDRFMSEDGKHLHCSTHGALFRPKDGYCVAGPCEGDSLRAVEVTVRDGAVVLVKA